MKRIQRIITIVLCILMFSSITVSASDRSGMENVPYDTYTYWNGFTNKKVVSAKPMFEVEKIIDAQSLDVESFSSLVDIHCLSDGGFCLLDSSKVIFVDKNYQVVSEITELLDGENQYTFEGAVGIYVDENNRMFICDSLEGKVYICDLSGNVQNVINRPESHLIPEEFQFVPKKVTVGNNGDVYVLSEGSFYGALIFDNEFNFKGFYGANTVVTSIGDFFTNLWDKFFTTDEQRAAGVQKVPYQFTDLYIDNDGFIWTSTGIISKWKGQTGQIRCLSPAGKNILKINAVEKNTQSDSFDFSDFGLASDGTLYRVQDFVGIAIDDNGFIYSLDKTYGKIFIYDNDCNALNIFGGGVAEGTQKGTFKSATAIDVHGDKIFVIDSEKNNITVFYKTNYGKTVMLADKLTLSGNHNEAKTYWEDVLSLDKNSQVAYRSIAKAYIIEENYSKALGYAKIGKDKYSYSTALYYVRNQWLQDNFVFIALVFIALLAIVAVAIIAKKKNKFSLAINNHNISVMLTTLVSPFKSFNDIKYKKTGSLIFGTTVILLYYFFSVSSTIWGGFLHTDFDATTFNSLFMFLGTVGVILLWILCNWAMCEAVDGKSNIKETFIVASCAVIPQLIYEILFLVLSNICTLEESGFMNLLFILSIILSFIVLCVGTMIINEFDFFKFLGTGIATLIAMAVVIFFVFMIAILFQQLFGFITTLFNEIWYR